MRPMLPSAAPDAVPAVAREQKKKWAPVAREPLLLRLHHYQEHPPAPGGEACHGRSSGGFPWLTTVGFAYLTFSSGMALRRSRGDPGAAAFVAFAYADLLLLLCCVRAHEHAELGSGLRDWLKLAVWLLTAALTLSFSYKVAAVMPPAATAVVWAMGIATVAGGFAALFCFRTAPQEVAAVDKIPNAHDDPEQISGAARWPPPLLNLDARRPIEP